MHLVSWLVCGQLRGPPLALISRSPYKASISSAAHPKQDPSFKVASRPEVSLPLPSWSTTPWDHLCSMHTAVFGTATPLLITGVGERGPGAGRPDSHYSLSSYLTFSVVSWLISQPSRYLPSPVVSVLHLFIKLPASPLRSQWLCGDLCRLD